MHKLEYNLFTPDYNERLYNHQIPHFCDDHGISLAHTFEGIVRAAAFSNKSMFHIKHTNFYAQEVGFSNLFQE